MVALPPNHFSPETTDEHTLPLGWRQSSEQPFGFASAAAAYRQTAEPLLYTGDGHLATFAPTGRGKGVSVIIPTLLTTRRPTIVLDLKGELFHVTAEQRRRMGQHVIAIDPFRIAVKQSDGLNPLDFFKLPGVDLESEAMTLAANLADGNTSTRERFWDLHGTALVSGLLAHFGGLKDDKQRTMLAVRDTMLADDPVYKIASLLDSKTVVSPMAHRELAGFLNQAERETRPSVLATATSYLKPFSSDDIADALKQTSFDLADILAGKPLTIYLIFPLDKLESHAGLLRLWLTVLMGTILRRREKPTTRTLMLLDECAQLGKFQLLKPLITLCRGFGLQAWLFFQSLAQLKAEYSEDWRTILDNVAVVQAFGFDNMFAAQEWGQFFRRDSDELLDLPDDEQFVHIARRGVFRSRRFNYLLDRRFAGLFNPNPLCEFLPPEEELPESPTDRIRKGKGKGR